MEIEGSLSLAGGFSGMNIAGNGALTMNTGNISQNGGSYSQGGAGGITAGSSGISSGGEIQTIGNHDIVSGRNFYFDGTDIFKREISGFPPQVINTSYKDFKQLVGKNDDNVFTGSNQFNSNTTEFAAKVSVGTRDGGGLFTQNLALNTSGNIESKTINNTTTINCGNVICDNGGVNSVAAKTFTTRTSGPAGWLIEQQPVEGNALDNILQIKGGQPGAFVSIIDSAFAGFVPNISLNPQTELLGGLIQTDNFRIGDGANSFDILQPKSGADANNLLIKSGASNTPIKFQNNAGTTDLMTLELEVGTNDGLLKVPAIEFGTSGTHNKIYQLQSGPTNLNLNIKQATASSEVVFLDHQDAEIIRIQKTQVELGNDIPILFGNYSFRPQQFYKDITNFSFNDSAIGATNLLFNTGNPAVQEWTSVNTGASNQAIDLINNPGAYKITIRQTTNGTQNEINGMRVMSDIVLSRPNDPAPIVSLPAPTAYSYELYNGIAPIITMVPGGLTWAIHATFPSTTGNETANIRITLTNMPYFA